MPAFYGAIDLVKNELRNAAIQNLGSAPASPVLGQLYYNTADQTLYYCTNVVGPIWTAAKAGAGATPGSTVTTQAVGDSPVVGTSNNFAREDHKHGREAFGNITAETAFGGTSSNGSAVTLARSDHMHGTPTHDNSAHASIPISALAVPAVDVSWNSKKITNLLDPIANTDAANKQYVDNLSAGLSWKEAVRAATTTNGTLGTAFANGQVIDGVTLATGQRILLKNQTTATENGIYTVNASGVPTRATDADATAEIEGMATFVMEGTTNADTAWVCTTNAPITVGSTNLVFAQFSGGGTYTAGAGLTLTANSFDVGAGTGIVVAADTVAIDFTTAVATNTTIPRKFAAGLTGTVSPETVTHNLNTRDVQLTVYNGATPYTAIEVDWDATTVNTAVIRYNPNLGAGYRVVVIG